MSTASAIVVMDAKIAAFRRATSGDRSAQPPTDFAQEFAASLPMQKAQLEFAAINDGLLKASGADNPADLSVIAYPLSRSLSTLRVIAADMTDLRLRVRFEQRLAELANLIEGPDSILEARRTELGLTEEAERVLRSVRSRRTAWLAKRLKRLSPEELAAIDAAVEPLLRLLEEPE